MSVSESANEGRWKGAREEKRERTQINDILLEIFELAWINGEDGDVTSVVMLVDSSRDLGCPLDNAEPSLVTILPVAADFGEESLEDLVVFILLLQFGLGAPHRPGV